MDRVYIQDMSKHVDEHVSVAGWLFNKRSSGKIHFLILRDGTGFMQAVASRSDVDEETFELLKGITQESSVRVEGLVRKDERAPGGYELLVTRAEVVQMAGEYPISLKEHGVDFLMQYRHLWLRTPRQHAVMRVRAEVIRACRDFLDNNGFLLIDAPVLTPSACEGTTTLFETDYFGDKAYLTQSGQLYMEAAAMAFGRVYCFGPVFRAEKSKTRRHLMEFWMVEPEMAFVELDESLCIQEEMVTYVVSHVLKNRTSELQALERDVSMLENVKPPFPRITYSDALDILKKHDIHLEWGDDFGGGDETVLASEFDRPVFVTRYPTASKAFYMKPDPENPDVVLCADLLAPEGYGEVIGGGQRIDDPELIRRRLEEHKLPDEAYRWYVDLRDFGSVPHSGFGLGIERLVVWICGLEHVRETSPFPRMLYRIYP
jgi:asparaginyl-tRNA synthetase